MLLSELIGVLMRQQRLEQKALDKTGGKKSKTNPMVDRILDEEEEEEEEKRGSEKEEEEEK